MSLRHSVPSIAVLCCLLKIRVNRLMPFYGARNDSGLTIHIARSRKVCDTRTHGTHFTPIASVGDESFSFIALAIRKATKQ